MSRTLTSLRDDAILAVLVRAPRASHDALRVCCQKLARLGERRALLRHRDAAGWAEHAIVVSGGSDDIYDGSGEPRPDNDGTWALVGGRWREMRRQPVPRCDCTTAVWRGLAVCAGGTVTLPDEHGEVRMTVGVPELVGFDAVEDRWLSLGPPPGAPGQFQGRIETKAVVDPVSGALVVVGGYGGENMGRSGPRGAKAYPAAQALDSPHGSWRTLAPLPQHVSSFAAAVVGEKLYVAGGICREGNYQEESTDALQIYDFRTRAWRLGPPLPRRQFGARGICVGSKFYVIGGNAPFVEISRDFVFDTVTGAWSAGPPLPQTSDLNSIFLHRGRVVVIGGGHLDFWDGRIVCEATPPVVLDEAKNEWVADAAVVPAMPPGLENNLGAMICSAPVG